MGRVALLALVAAVAAACSGTSNQQSRGAESGAVDVGGGLRTSLARDASNMSVYEQADGTKSIHFNGGYQHAHMVRLDADGSLNYNCVTDADEAERFLAGGDQ